MSIAMIDNYDSFTYNLVHLVKELGAEIEVFRNDQFELPELERFEKIMLSPGPGIPEEAGYATMVYFIFRTIGCFTGTFLLRVISSVIFFGLSVIMMLAAMFILFFADYNGTVRCGTQKMEECNTVSGKLPFLFLGRTDLLPADAGIHTGRLFGRTCSLAHAKLKRRDSKACALYRSCNST